MSQLADLEALLANVDRRVVAIQLVRFDKTRVGMAIVDVGIGILGALADSHTDTSLNTTEPALDVRLTAADGSLVTSIEIAPAPEELVPKVLQRCIAAAWPQKLAVVVDRDASRLESWNPTVPFGVEPSALNPAGARAALQGAGYRIEERPDWLALTLDTIRPVNDLRYDAFEFLKSESEKAALNAWRREQWKGQHHHVSVTMSYDTLRVHVTNVPMSELIRRERPGTEVSTAVARADILALSVEALGDLCSFGKMGYARLLPRDVQIARGLIKQLLCAHALGEAHGAYR